MGAPLNNKNATKWTEEAVLACLERMAAGALEDHDTVHITTVLVREGLYGEIWTYWKRRFDDNPLVKEKIERVDHILETKLIHGGLTGELDPVVVKFALANGYSWKRDEKTKGGRGFEIKKRNLEDAYVVGEDGDRIMLKDYQLTGFEEHIKQPDESRRKWTDDEVLGYIERMKNAVTVPNVYTHYAALLRTGMPKSAYETWQECYSAEIQEKIMELELIYKEKLLQAALHRKVHRSMALYVLKKFYHLSEEERPVTGDPNEIKGTFILTENEIYLIGCSN